MRRSSSRNCVPPPFAPPGSGVGADVAGAALPPIAGAGANCQLVRPSAIFSSSITGSTSLTRATSIRPPRSGMSRTSISSVLSLTMSGLAAPGALASVTFEARRCGAGRTARSRSPAMARLRPVASFTWSAISRL